MRALAVSIGLARANFIARLEERFAALPGVERASISATVPFGMISSSKKVQRAGLQSAPEAAVDEGLTFQAKWSRRGRRLLQHGRSPALTRSRFHRAQKRPRRAVPPWRSSTKSLAKKLWPDGDALGQRLQFAGDESSAATQAEGDIKPGRAWRSSASCPRRATVSLSSGAAAPSTCRSRAAFRATLSSS